MIYLPPPQPLLNKDIRISGEVEIHPTASLAPGVILQAAAESRIVIGADACVGMGVIISAFQGDIEVGSGAILGSGVLIIGASKIGNNACIGTSTTIFQADIEAMVVIEPGSIVGDVSRQVSFPDSQASQGRSGSENKDKTKTSQTVDGFSSATSVKKKPSRGFEKKNNPASHSGENQGNEDKKNPVEPLVKPSTVPVVGQVYLNELLITLFPHRKGLDPNSGKLT